MSGTRENSGLIDLDALMREANGPPAIESAPAVEVPLAARSAPASVPAPARAAAPILAAAPERRSKRSARGVLVIAAAIAVTATGTWLYERPRTSHATPEPVVVVLPRAPASPPPRPLEPSRTAELLPGAGDLPAVAAALPLASAAKPSAIAKKSVAEASTATVTTMDIPEPAPARANDLGRAMHDAVGDGSQRTAKADAPSASGARTVRPSPGAVIGAINAVLPAARECLGPDDAIRAGTVTFRSDGSVAKVELVGARASDACIRSAMMRARVEPFADDTFTTRITVRP